jgi:hypothetical protein
MRSLILISAIAALAACDSTGRRGRGDGGTGNGPDMAQCIGLGCQIATCTNGATTSISGVVYDPAGTTPLFNVSVYIPNAPLADIPDGVDINGICTSCQAPLTGAPIVVGLTDSTGTFHLENVPSGANIPLVMQTGKFRRQVSLTTVGACVDNKVGQKDSTGAETIMRLPRNQSEGHIPLIAITTGGCEGLECVVRTYGFDDAEFTTSSGSGRIHLFTGQGYLGTPPAGGKAPGGSGDPTEAYRFWGSTDIYNYDMILNSCECDAHPRDSYGPAYDNMKTYLDHGGRLFTSDYQYNWFTDTQAPADFKKVATWFPNMTAPYYSAPYYVDQTSAKGMAMNDWLQFVFSGTTPNGQVSLNTIFYNVAGVNPAYAKRYIYSSSNGMPADVTAGNYTAKYLTFDTPVGAADGGTTQCGRAVFADVHVSDNITCTTYPSGCESLTKTQAVTAFEFLFFDLGSCDSDVIAPPPIM